MKQQINTPCVLSVIAFVSAVAFLLPIAMIVIGAIYKDDCPVESMIPIYLIVMGAAGLLRLWYQTCQVSPRMLL